MNIHLLEHFSEALEFDAVTVAKEMTDSGFRMQVGGWEDLILSSPGSGQFRHLVGLQILETTVQLLSQLKTRGLCHFDPEHFRKEVEASHSGWNRSKDLPSWNYPCACREPLWVLVHLELTRQVLKAREELTELTRQPRLTMLTPIKSSICTDAAWVRQALPGGTIRITAQELPEWITKEQRFLRPRLSLEYSLPDNLKSRG